MNSILVTLLIPLLMSYFVFPLLHSSRLVDNNQNHRHDFKFFSTSPTIVHNQHRFELMGKEHTVHLHAREALRSVG